MGTRRPRRGPRSSALGYREPRGSRIRPSVTPVISSRKSRALLSPGCWSSCCAEQPPGSSAATRRRLWDVELTEVLAPLQDFAVAVTQQWLLPIALVVPHDHVDRFEAGLGAAALADLLLEHLRSDMGLRRAFRVLTVREPHAHDGAGLADRRRVADHGGHHRTLDKAQDLQARSGLLDHDVAIGHVHVPVNAVGAAFARRDDGHMVQELQMREVDAVLTELLDEGVHRPLAAGGGN